MITVTPQAARQILASAEQGGMEKLALRVAARRTPEGHFEYGLGFDELKDDDLTFDCEGLQVVCEPEYEALLKGATLDFVEIEPGEYRFIFLNPNDPHFQPPQESAGCAPSSCSSGGCSGCGPRK
jgi:iron-sulfur cluster assembly protein